MPETRMEALAENECRRLLAERHLGRLAIPDFGGPAAGAWWSGARWVRSLTPATCRSPGGGDGAPTRRAPRHLLAAAGLATQGKAVALAGLAVYGAGPGIALVPFACTAVRRPPHTAASWMLGVGMAWLVVAGAPPRIGCWLAPAAGVDGQGDGHGRDPTATDGIQLREVG